MTPILTSALIAHVLLGVVGLGGLHVAFMQIIRRAPPWHIIIPALWTALISFLLSWAAGAYYYVIYYGPSVKPHILAGPYPWAHQFVMEAKEHIFILIPFLTIVALAAAYLLRIEENPKLKTTTSILLAFTLALGTAIAAAGMLISGAVR